ncbi:SCO family protein [Aquicella lusitana]|jgi:Uncharacterized protein SCO1/SenC/PrrC, involved in biogenesis of respiratory and photosynthetic systems|uniref:Protein SCO1/2 n=1 Tax=Aquicella lusitana TaxID=254246 RepID=A0A370GJ58_9COXI|nr:SCO family protein [Aquicella lusitana]RDI42414.1 protein SCO1/2 [Aquicella lusitana]VVC74124.1 hypothetical protein AQULUS_18890 [Aquicella lusitana]
MEEANQTVSTQKIILFVVFISAALMTLLFVFHMGHKPQPTLAEGDGTLFPAPRDIKPFQLATDKQSFTQKDFLNHWTLLFFGFTHCSSVCPVTMTMLNQAYEKLQRTYPGVQVVLVSLDPDRDTPSSVMKYARSFNPNFIGVTGKIPELRKLQSQLGIFAARDASATENNYQLQHTSSILLINPQGKWAGIFKYGMPPEQFANAFDVSIKSLSRYA